jgi:hypothetical protein
METWILIMIIGAGYKAGGAITTQEFTSRDRCIAAAQFIAKSVDGGYRQLQTACVRK